jgi:DNA-binding transcriptional regulator YhcF (GntR family)
MIIRVDPQSPTPPYEQIREQVATMVMVGALPAGTRLPAIRQLSKDLGVASGTVARSYRELEAEQVIVTRGRHGTFVADIELDPRLQRDEELSEAARSFAIRTRQLRIDPERALASARTALESVGAILEE